MLLSILPYLERICNSSHYHKIRDSIFGVIQIYFSATALHRIFHRRIVLKHIVFKINYQLVKKKRIKTKLPVKVLFVVTDNSLWCAQSVYDSFHEDSRFDPTVVALYDFIGANRIPDDPIGNRSDYKIKTLEKNYSFFKDRGMNVIRSYKPETGEFYNLKSLDPDIVFYELPYHSSVPTEYWTSHVSQFALTCYIPYGYKIANRYQEHFNLRSFPSFWRIFAESGMHGKLFKAYSNFKGKNVFVSGYPKLDEYISTKQPSPGKYWKIARPDIKRVIWAPHWTINDKVIAFSTFHNNYKFFLKLALKYKSIEWVFKPHQELYPFCIQEGLMTVEEADAYYNKWDSLRNTSTYLKGGYFDLFKTSDALITCCGSFLAEYLPTEKPILYLANPKSIGFNIIGQKLIESYYRAETNDEIEKFILEVILKQNDYLREKRLANMKHVVINHWGAGKTIKNHILREFSRKVQKHA